MASWLGLGTEQWPPLQANSEQAHSDAQQPTQLVQVISNTWARDSHDLFDFEAHHLHTQAFTVNEPVTFVRNGTDVAVCSEAPPEQSEMLLRLVQKDASYYVDKAGPRSPRSSKKLWQVVRDLESSCHPLAEGDILKLGRFKFRVRQMVTSACNGVQPQLGIDETQGMLCRTDDPEHEAAQSSGTCRICLLDGAGQEDGGIDPLIRPCQCRGSIEYVHLGCLRNWIKMQLSLSDTPCGSYFYRPPGCELCRSVYPAYIYKGKWGNERETLVEVPRTTPPFITLENMVRDSQQHTSKGLHVISLADNKLLKFGRGHESDIRIADVSISRFHASVRFQNGRFLLEDHNSKFGTLVCMRKPRALEPGSSLSIQVGRSVLSLSLQTAADTSTQHPSTQHETSL